ncbi:MAG: tetratricopeptide repeat protein [Terriglobia bacterium]|jgi:tetratricopeptide (TPR) repeat protein
MRSSTGYFTSLAITAVSLALLTPARGTAIARAGRPGAGPSLLPASSEEKSAPLSQEQTFKMLQATVPSQQIEAFARKDGVDFKVTPALERDLRKAGAAESLIQLLKKLGNGPAPAQPPVAGESEDLSRLLRTAEDALGRKDFAEGVKALKSVVAIQPGMPEAWFNLGYAYTGLHEPDEAVKAYQKTLELAPDLFAARLNLGILLMEQKQPQAALEHLQKATTLKPENVRAHLYYARALAQTRQPEAARKEFQEVTHLDPHLAIAPFELGQLELQQKHPREALAAFGQALAMDPKLVQAGLGAALAAEALNDTAQAVPHFEKYLASRPDDVETQFHLARLYLDQNQNEKAGDTLESIYRVKPDLPGLTAALGDVNARLKKLPEAEKYYRLAVGSQPGVADLHRALGEILLKEQKFPEAEGEFRAALKIDSHNRDAAIGLASSLDLQQRYPEAIAILERLAKAPDAAPYVFFVLATCYDHLRAHKEALANYEHFLQLSNGKNPDQEWQATQRAKLLRRELSK